MRSLLPNTFNKRTAISTWIKVVIGASAMVCFSLTPAFAQCTLNGISDPTCAINNGTTINTYTDTSGSSNITTVTGVLTYGTPGTMTIFGGVELTGTTSLTGTGTLTLSNGQIGTNSNPLTLTNNSTIAGSGIIGSNGLTSENLSLNNTGTINANSSSNTLSIQGNGGSIANSGTFEATGGGILTLATSAAINNGGGQFTSTGAGSLVNVSTTIQGGTLNTSLGGVMQTTGGATLDGSTAAGAITVSDGSTYTDATTSTITKVVGTLNLGTSTGGTMSLLGGLELTGSTTLNTFGAGSLTLKGGQIGTNSNPLTLTNNGLIQGSGIIGSNGLTFGNLGLNNTGTINANSSSNTLSIQGSGSPIVNTGLIEASAGGILNLATSPTAINNKGGNITSTGTNSVVSVNTTIQGGTLNTSAGGVLQTGASGATLDASSQGAITLSDGSTYTAGAANTTLITNVTGTLNLGTTNGSTLALGGALRLVGDTTISTPGTGSITMAQGQIGTNSNPLTLTNNGLIQGSGVIGSNATTTGNLALANNGTINANSSANALSIQGNGGSIVNANLFEATSGATLNINTSAAVNNQNGTILSATGSTVNLTGTIQGGTLTTQGTGVMQTSGSVTLDGNALGAITLSDGSTYTAGAANSTTITNVTGTLNLGTTNGSTLALGGALRLVGDTTISTPGTGSITMAQGQIGTNGNPLTLTNNGLIQGSGVIGSNATTTGNLALANNGTINANSSANSLSIEGDGSSIVNANLFEATSGGTLNINTSAVVNNENGTILSTGAGSTVNLSGTIQGGTLTTSSNGLMQTSGAVVLDGFTLGAITLSDGSTYTAGVSGTSTLTDVRGQLNLGTVSGSTLQVTGTSLDPGYFRVTGNTTLSGPGSVVLNGGLIGTNGNPLTLTNNVLIQGTGVIGSNAGEDTQNLSLNNTATINANSSGNTLSIQGDGGSIVNTGLIEATSGGILNLATSSAIDNQTGNITAGAGSTVNVNTTIQGGTLNTSGSGVMQTSLAATLDGTTNGAITISDGSTYTAGNGPLTSILGTLKLGTVSGGTLALSGQLRLVGNTTLSGPGSVTMSGNGQIGTNGNPLILTNNSTIQGSGLVGSNAGSLTSNLSVNNNTGTILANVSGQTLTLGGSGTLTNTGTMQANAGSTLLSSMSGLSSSTFSGNTLLTGTYNMFGGGTLGTAGTIQINALGTLGGEIVNNAATILLSGPNSNFFDASGLDALSKLASNSGSFSIVDGRNFNTPGAFSNTGTVDIGSGDTFSVALGVSPYVQTDGTTLDDGTLGPGVTEIFGGFLEGVGLVDNAVEVTDGGTVAPGDPPGTLTIDGTYTMGGSGNLLIGLAGTSLGDYDVLDVNGLANLGGTVEFDLQSGFNVAAGDTFFIVEDTSRTGTFATDNFGGLDLAAGLNANILYDQGTGSNEVELVISGTVSSTPEPSTWLLFVGGLGALAAFQIRRKRRLS